MSTCKSMVSVETQFSMDLLTQPLLTAEKSLEKGIIHILFSEKKESGLGNFTGNINFQFKIVPLPSSTKYSLQDFKLTVTFRGYCTSN